MSAASAHLARLGASSRPAGSAAAAEAREYCAGVLRGLGFSVSELPFEYSRMPGAFATPVVGMLVPVFAACLLAVRSIQSPLAIGLASAVVVVGLVLRYVGGAGVLDLPVARAHGVNLEAVRGSAEPTVWLVAHIDSKWQPVPMLARIAGVVASAIGLLGSAAAVLVGHGGVNRVTVTFFALATAGAIPLMLSVVGSKNHGTLDNASGVATVLEAAALVPADASVGVLITDAEELALAGARAWARARRPAVALNCDSVDDESPLLAMYSAPAPGRLVTAVSAAARERGEPLRVTRLIPGVLTDHVALAAAGWATLTLSGGTIRTLQRIHTSRDTLASMRGTGVSRAAQVLAQTAVELC